MYHRVCPRTPETAPWFARGTAVTPEAFASQLEWLHQRLDIVPLEDLIARPVGERPRVALTFDDGYAEVLHSVAPLCDRLGVTGTCFASAGPAIRGEPLWFDVWYGAVAAVARRGELLRVVRSWGFEALPNDLDWWVRGPMKRWLAGLDSASRRERLAEATAAMGSQVVLDLYLSLADLRALRGRGWRVGGHGDRHEALTACDDRTLDHELAASLAMLDQVGEAGPRVFAYPDGAWDKRVRARVARAGFAIACGVEPGRVVHGSDWLAVPRLFCRGVGPLPHPLVANAAGSGG